MNIIVIQSEDITRHLREPSNLRIRIGSRYCSQKRSINVVADPIEQMNSDRDTTTSPIM